MVEPLDVSLYLVGYMKAANRFIGCGERLFDVNQRAVQWLDNPDEHASPWDDPIAPGVMFVPYSRH
jgi:hypothetical protein